MIAILFGAKSCIEIVNGKTILYSYKNGVKTDPIEIDENGFGWIPPYVRAAIRNLRSKL